MAQEKIETVEKLTNAKQVVALLKHAAEKKTKISEIAGALGERIKDAADNANLHRSAFGAVLKLYRMSEDKRNDWMRAFAAYCDMAEEAGLFGSSHVGDLLDEPANDDGGEDVKAAARNADAIMEGIKPIPMVPEDEKPPRRGRPPKLVQPLDDDVAPSSYKLN